MPYTGDELERRYQAVQYVIATQRLAGITLDDCTIKDLKRVARGELTTDEMREDIFKKLKMIPCNYL